MRHTAALAITISLAAPSAAFAQSSGYGSSPSGGTPGAGDAHTVASSSSSLPFTGLDTLPLVGGGAALLLLGAGLAHGARGRETR